MSAQALLGSVQDLTPIGVIRVEFNSAHRSRYNWKSRNALPPHLTKVNRVLKKLAKKHSEFPGIALDGDRINTRLANEIGGMRGAADDLVRALKNLAVLIPIVFHDGREITLYDADQMERAMAYVEGGELVPEPTDDIVRSRVEELLLRFADQDEPAPESETYATANDTAAIPDIEDVILCLDAAKRTVTLEGNAALDDVVVDPMSVLRTLYEACPTPDLERLLDRVRSLGFLTPLGNNVYRVTLTPALVPDTTDRVPDSLERELTQYRVLRQQADDLLAREQARLTIAYDADVKRMQDLHDERCDATCDEIRSHAERKIESRRREIDACREEALATLEREYHERKAAIEVASSRDLQTALNTVQSESDDAIARTQAEAEASWTEAVQQSQKDLIAKEEVELRPLVLKHEEYDERVALLERLLERRNAPTIS